MGIVSGQVTGPHFFEMSDVDIAVAANCPVYPDERVELHRDLGRLLSRTLDLRGLSILHGIILQQILSKGVVLKKENTVYFEKRMIEMIDFRQDIFPILESGMKNYQGILRMAERAAILTKLESVKRCLARIENKKPEYTDILEAILDYTDSKKIDSASK